jgi:predicted lipoprotein with Yx(FWY)xxD motif
VSPAFAAGSTVDVTTTTNFGAVLTNTQGFALYTYPSDHDGMSACNASCLAVWPAVTVATGTTPTAGPGVNGTVAAVVQSDGTDQVTYNGSPLYTFVGDTSPGEVTGNNVGGFLVATVAAAPTAPTTPAPTSFAPTSLAPTTPAPTTAGTSPAPASSPAAPTSPVAPSGTSTSPVVAPGPAAATSSSGATASAAAATSATSSPPSLAATGPGPGLVWMVVVGVGLIALSLAMLVVFGDRGRAARRAGAPMTRAGSWLLGR